MVFGTTRFALDPEGWNCAADQLARVESQEEGIKDFVLLYFSAALGVSADELWKRAGAETVANSCDYLTGCRSTFATASESFGRADPAKTRDVILLPNGSFFWKLKASAYAAMSTMHKNVVGLQVRKRRYNLGLKQPDLAARLQVPGWEIDRAGVSKIESQLIWVSDFQMLYRGAQDPTGRAAAEARSCQASWRKHRQTPNEKSDRLQRPYTFYRREPRIPQPAS